MDNGTPAPRIFLLSPAHLGGKRAELLLGGRGRFALAERLRSGGTVSLGEAFSFLSGLYFRGKLAYANRFARPPAGVLGVQVITSNRGLIPADAPMTADDLRAMAATPIDAGEPGYRAPLERDLQAIEQFTRLGDCALEIVLLGSVASGKYLDTLAGVIGPRLLFPLDFVGRGDMSRGALLLRAVRAEWELVYAPATTTARRGHRPTTQGGDDGADAGPSTPVPAHPGHA